MVRTRALVSLLLLAVTACDTDDVAVPDSFRITIENRSGALTASDGTEFLPALAPGVWLVHDEGTTLFTAGTEASAEMEAQCELGDPAPWREALRAQGGNAGSYPVEGPGTYLDGPITPGSQRQLDVTAEPGQVLSIMGMFGQSNDVCVGLDALPLFEPEAFDGEVTDRLRYYDAGTELNEEPGIGSGQPADEADPDAGTPEDGVVVVLDGSVDQAGHRYPDLPSFLRITVEPRFE